MKPSAQRILVAASVVILAVIAASFLMKKTSPVATTVTSSDGNFTLTVPAGALPAGTSAADITLTRVNAPRQEGRAAILAQYRLEPANLTFAAPVTFALASVPVGNALPFVFLVNASARTVETPEGTTIALNPDKTMRITGTLRHFSNLAVGALGERDKDKATAKKEGDRVRITLPAEDWLPPIDIDLGPEGPDVTITPQKVEIEPAAESDAKVEVVDKDVDDLLADIVLTADAADFSETDTNYFAFKLSGSLAFTAGSGQLNNSFDLGVKIGLDALLDDFDPFSDFCPGTIDDPQGQSVDVLKIGDKCYPTMQFHTAERDECASAHWHGGRATALDGSTMADPAPKGCGFGMTSQVPAGTVRLSPEDAAKFIGGR